MAPPRITSHRRQRLGVLSRILFFLCVAIGAAMVVYRVREQSVVLDFEGVVVGQEIEIASETGGKLVRVAVEPNMAVEEGQLLAELVDEPLLVEIDSARADIERFKSSLEQAQSDPSFLARIHDARERIVEASGEIAVAEIDIRALRNEIDTASRTLVIADDRANRSAALFDKQALTLAQLEASKLEAIQARRAVDEMTARLAHLEHRAKHLRELSQLYQRRAAEVEHETNQRVADLETELSKREAELRSLRARQSTLMVNSNRKGIVSQTPRSVGEIMSAGQPILFLTTSDNLWVEAYIPAEDLGSVQPGDRYEIFLNPGAESYAGIVKGILPTLRAVSRSSVGFFDDRYKIAVALVEFEDEDRAKASLLVGQEVRVRRKFR